MLHRLDSPFRCELGRKMGAELRLAARVLPTPPRNVKGLDVSCTPRVLALARHPDCVPSHGE
jgi:hypothetical protein